jgi:hypothetical protein
MDSESHDSGSVLRKIVCWKREPILPPGVLKDGADFGDHILVIPLQNWRPARMLSGSP